MGPVTRALLALLAPIRAFAQAAAGASEHAVVYVELHGAQHAFDVFPSPRTVRTIEYCQQFLDAAHRGVIK